MLGGEHKCVCVNTSCWCPACLVSPWVSRGHLLLVRQQRCAMVQQVTSADNHSKMTKLSASDQLTRSLGSSRTSLKLHGSSLHVRVDPVTLKRQRKIKATFHS